MSLKPNFQGIPYKYSSVTRKKVPLLADPFWKYTEYLLQSLTKVNRISKSIPIVETSIKW